MLGSNFLFLEFFKFLLIVDLELRGRGVSESTVSDLELDICVIAVINVLKGGDLFIRKFSNSERAV